MKVRIKSPFGGLKYETKGSVGFDLRAKEDYKILPGENILVDTGTIVEIPEGYALILLARSSTFKNFGLMLLNGIGLIDNDYCGENDTLKFNYYNISKNVCEIKKGDRIGQGVFVSVLKPEFEFVDSMKNENRGGFGSTGIK